MSDISRELWRKNWKAPEIKDMVPTKWGWVVQCPEHFIMGKYIDIGYGTYINAQSGVKIDDDVQIGGGCHIYSRDTISNKSGPIWIKQGAKIGAHCVILPGVTIGKCSTVGAMSLIKHNVEDGETVWGRY